MSDDTQYLPPPGDEPNPYDPYEQRDPVAEREAARRRNSLLLVVLAAVVCVVGALLALGGLRGGSGGGAPGAEETTPAAANPQPAGPPADQIAFTSPTGNIGCTLSSQGARCDIDSKEWEPPPKPTECQANWGIGVQVGPESAGLVCAADSVLGQGEPLAYGAKQQVGPYLCTSSEEGMRCENSETGKGFTVARAAYTTF